MLGSPYVTSVCNDEATEHRDSFPEVKGVTNYVGKFIVETGFDSIPEDVIELGKKSVYLSRRVHRHRIFAQDGATICSVRQWSFNPR